MFTVSSFSYSDEIGIEAAINSLATPTFSFSDFSETGSIQPSTNSWTSTVSREESETESTASDHGWTIFLLLFIVAAAIAGNLLVCLAVYCKKKLRNMFNYFLVSLALSDMMSAVLIMPLSIVKIYVDDLPVPKMICVTWYSLDVLFTSSTICHLCMISVDRYLTLTFPLRYGHAKKKKHTLIKIALVWIVSICIAGPLFILTMLDAEDSHHFDHRDYYKDHDYPSDHHNYYSDDSDSNSNSSSRRRYHHQDDGILLKGCGPETPTFVISATVISFYLPLLIMTVMYALTVRALQLQLKERRRIAVTATNSSSGCNYNNESKKPSYSSALYLSPSLRRVVFPDKRKGSAPALPLMLMRDQHRKLSALQSSASPYTSLYNKRSLQISNGDTSPHTSSVFLAPSVAVTACGDQTFEHPSSVELTRSYSSRRWRQNSLWKANSDSLERPTVLLQSTPKNRQCLSVPQHHHHQIQHRPSCSYYEQILRRTLSSRMLAASSAAENTPKVIERQPSFGRYLLVTSPMSGRAGQEWTTSATCCCRSEAEQLYHAENINPNHHRTLSILLPTDDRESSTLSGLTTYTVAAADSPARSSLQASYFDGKNRRFRFDRRSFTSSFRRHSSVASSTNSSVRRVHGGLDKGRRAVQVLGILFAVFVACYLPFFAVYVIRGTCSLCRPYISTNILTILEWVAYSAALFNPIIYHIFNPDFRRAFHQLLRCRCCNCSCPRCCGSCFGSKAPPGQPGQSIPLKSLNLRQTNYGTAGKHRDDDFGIVSGGRASCSCCGRRCRKNARRIELPTCRVETV